MAKWTIKQRNDVSRDLNFTDKDGNPIDLTGATVYFTVKSAYDTDNTDSTALIQKNITSHTNPTAGQTVLNLSETDTDVAAGKYLFDFKLKTAIGAETNYDPETFIVQEVITRRNS